MWYADVGTAVHALIEGTEPTYPADTLWNQDAPAHATIAYANYLEFLESTGWQQTAAELEVYGVLDPADRVGYVGHCDAVYDTGDGESVVVDFKTCGRVRVRHRHQMQVAAYVNALPCTKGYLLYLSRDTIGEWELVEVDIDTNLQDFAATHRLWLKST